MLAGEERWRESEVRYAMQGSQGGGGWSMNRECVCVCVRGKERNGKGGANKDHLRRGEFWEGEK